MAQTVPSRQTARERIKALVTADITEFEAIYDHIPRSLEGYSPACTISSVGFAYSDRPYRYKYRFAVGVWVRRDLLTGVSVSEDTLDTLVVKVAQLHLDNAADATLRVLRIPNEQFSITSYPIVDGTPYRAEFVIFETRPQTGVP